MNRLPIAALVLMAFGAVVVSRAFAEDKKLTTEQVLRADLQAANERILQLEIALANAQATIADREQRLNSVLLTAKQEETQAKRKALDEELVKALGGDPKKGDTFDPVTKTVKKVGGKS